MRLELLGKSLSSLGKLDEKLISDSGQVSTEKATGFMDYLKDALGEVDQSQKVASASADNLAAGDGLRNTCVDTARHNSCIKTNPETRSN